MFLALHIDELEKLKHTVAVHSVDMDISGVTLGRKAIITNVNPGALDVNVLNVQRVEEIGVLGKSSGIG